ncbi:hypothetical protein AKJ44_00950 [candidate division MSBL1 archaeon SCGC-AAA261F17]|uniref:SpoVT-AbrB domain-containing protein n=1 Tax=candidate division MSBL1 archaeon SCGC-AAA261F17 TaxID=1698274 RepID=A0A133V744_9EURY|nr:hypothetical protein AKJ44_00950 [candidate division MSBL1 archaeon SCGC-AAA261F17]
MSGFKSEVDKKGRIVIPVEIRRELNIKPLSEVEVEIEEVTPRKSFVESARELREHVKEKEDAVKVLHEKSPFR